ncbi:hypothetical protein ABTF40_19510, partial [Acinetobacter baumannii]|nr:hypothetical protein [Acinetobacter baumannii]
FRGRLIHFEIILLNKLLMLGLCNKAVATTKSIKVFLNVSFFLQTFKDFADWRHSTFFLI